MTKLHWLRKRLSRLRRARAWSRRITAVSTLAVVVLWLLAALFALDVIFQLSVLQRLLVAALAAAAVVWIVYRSTLPLAAVFETDLDMALLVEKRQGIDSDLIAALQFEGPEASSWGSPRLEAEVIDRVAGWGNRLNVFTGFSVRRLVRSMLAIALTAAVMVALAVWLPDHARVFLHRLLLGSFRYPTRTVIERVAVNGQTTVPSAHEGPRPVRIPQHRVLTFIVQCSGKAPQQAEARLWSSGGQSRRLPLPMLTLDERRQRIERAAGSLRQILADPSGERMGHRAREAASLVCPDVPRAAEPLAAGAADRRVLERALAEITRVLDSWPGAAARTAVYEGGLDRLLGPIQYAIDAGDAATHPGRISAIPPPIVQTRLAVTAPPFARAGRKTVLDPDSRRLSVLKGSEVRLAVESINGKGLQQVWLAVKTAASTGCYGLSAVDEGRLKWELPPRGSPLSVVVEDVFFELQVVDEDDLSLEQPISGRIVVRADRGPNTAARGERLAYPRSWGPELEDPAAADEVVDLDGRDSVGGELGQRSADSRIAGIEGHLGVRRDVKRVPAGPGPRPTGGETPGKAQGQSGGSGGGRLDSREGDGASDPGQPAADVGATASNHDEAAAGARPRQPSWFAKLPPEIRKALQSAARRPPPRGYEERLGRYFESIDD